MACNQEGQGEDGGGCLPDGETAPFVIRRELDLHTFRPRDIPLVVQDYLEEAWCRGFATVRLVHGRGIGYQRQVVQQVLARHPLVLSFADDLDSRLGATLVRLRARGTPGLPDQKGPVP